METQDYKISRGKNIMTKKITLNLWDMQPFEKCKPKQYEYFCYYRDLGFKRTVKQVYKNQEYGCRKKFEKGRGKTMGLVFS